MSYLQRWRKYNAEVQVIAQISSSESEHEKSDDLTSSNEVEPVYQQDSSDAEFNNDINIHDVGEIEGYHSDSSSASAYISDEHSDAEEFAANDVFLGEQLAECVTKHKCTRSFVNDLLVTLRQHGHRLPKDSRTLLQTPRFIDTNEKCGGGSICIWVLKVDFLKLQGNLK